jgi:hypothetical protein
MKGQPKATVEIWYDHADGESEIFANQLSLVLGNTNVGIGWDVSIKPFAEVTDPSLPFIRQDSGANGLAYAANTVSLDRNSPLQVMFNAVELSLGWLG